MSDVVTINGVKITDTISRLKEVSSSPATLTGSGQLYTKSTNRIYFKDGDGTEHTLLYASTNYAEMYMNANGTAMVIETANTPVMSRLWTTGVVSNWTFGAGSTGAITAYADGSGTYGANAIIVTSALHGLATGDIVSIRGTAAPNNYNGIFSITKIDANSFWIVKVGWNADAGASDWDQGSYLKAGTGAAGYYAFEHSPTVAGTANNTCTFQAYVNTTPCPKCISRRKFPNADVGCPSSGSFLQISDGDRVSYVVTQDATQDITISYGNIRLSRI